MVREVGQLLAARSAAEDELQRVREAISSTRATIDVSERLVRAQLHALRRTLVVAAARQLPTLPGLAMMTVVPMPEDRELQRIADEAALTGRPRATGL
jgi:hypothetical protein